MKLTRCLTVAGAPAALTLALAGPAFAAPSVSVRVEGLTKTLLETKTVTAPSTGSITKGGTPAGTCPDDTAAGALDVATHHDWGGTYSSGLGIEVNSILGTAYSYSHGSYWAFYVNNRYASSGVCDTALAPGESLLFAAVPAKGKTPVPLVIRAPKTATAGRPFTVRAVDYPGKGSATKPVSGVSFAGTSTKTNAKGVATLTVSKAETLSLVGSRTGFIRSAAARVTITK